VSVDQERGSSWTIDWIEKFPEPQSKITYGGTNPAIVGRPKA
jgi:hypothetical protein